MQNRQATGVLVALSILAALTVCASAWADREPVLKQIKVPHDYYYREMYLPDRKSVV